MIFMYDSDGEYTATVTVCRNPEIVRHHLDFDNVDLEQVASAFGKEIAGAYMDGVDNALGCYFNELSDAQSENFQDWAGGKFAANAKRGIRAGLIFAQLHQGGEWPVHLRNQLRVLLNSADDHGIGWAQREANRITKPTQ